jgi:hypothetical protein
MHPEFKAIDKAIYLIGLSKQWSIKEDCLEKAALNLQIVMDIGESTDARQLAATIAEAFGLFPRIEVLRKQAA